MKIFWINDKINFWKNNWKTVLDMIKNDYSYIEWCFSNIEDFVLTNNINLITNKDEICELNNKINEQEEKFNTDIENKNQIIKSLKENIKITNLLLPCFFDLSKDKYYNPYLQEVILWNQNFIKFIDLPKLIPDRKDEPLNKLKIIYDNKTLEIGIQNLKISNIYFKEIELISWYNDVDYYQRTIATLTNSENKKNVINYNWILNMNNWWEYLYKYSKRVWWSREDWDFDYWYESSDNANL